MIGDREVVRSKKQQNLHHGSVSQSVQNSCNLDILETESAIPLESIENDESMIYQMQNLNEIIKEEQSPTKTDGSAKPNTLQKRMFNPMASYRQNYHKTGSDQGVEVTSPRAESDPSPYQSGIMNTNRSKFRGIADITSLERVAEESPTPQYEKKDTKPSSINLQKHLEESKTDVSDQSLLVNSQSLSQICLEPQQSAYQVYKTKAMKKQHNPIKNSPQENVLVKLCKKEEKRNQKQVHFASRSETITETILSNQENSRNQQNLSNLTDNFSFNQSHQKQVQDALKTKIYQNQSDQVKQNQFANVNVGKDNNHTNKKIDDLNRALGQLRRENDLLKKNVIDGQLLENERQKCILLKNENESLIEHIKKQDNTVRNQNLTIEEQVQQIQLLKSQIDPETDQKLKYTQIELDKYKQEVQDLQEQIENQRKSWKQLRQELVREQKLRKTGSQLCRSQLGSPFSLRSNSQRCIIDLQSPVQFNRISDLARQKQFIFEHDSLALNSKKKSSVALKKQQKQTNTTSNNFKRANNLDLDLSEVTTPMEAQKKQTPLQLKSQSLPFASFGSTLKLLKQERDSGADAVTTPDVVDHLNGSKHPEPTRIPSSIVNGTQEKDKDHMARRLFSSGQSWEDKEQFMKGNPKDMLDNHLPDLSLDDGSNKQMWADLITNTNPMDFSDMVIAKSKGVCKNPTSQIDLNQNENVRENRPSGFKTQRTSGRISVMQVRKLSSQNEINPFPRNEIQYKKLKKKLQGSQTSRAVRR